MCLSFRCQGENGQDGRPGLPGPSGPPVSVFGDLTFIKTKVVNLLCQ